MSLFQQQKAFDPYAAQRQAAAGHYNQLESEYQGYMQDPSKGLPDPAMQQMLEKQTEQSVRNQYPGAGRSQWLNDRVSSELLKLRLSMIDKRQQSLDKLRTMQTQTLGAMGGPAQPGGPSPFQTISNKALGQFAGAGAETAAEGLFGRQGGMAVAQNKQQPGKTSVKVEKTSGGMGNADDYYGPR